MVFADYMKDVAEEMKRKSDGIRRAYKTHNPTAGDCREDLVKNFLKDSLPKRFGVSTGLIISPEEKFSKQADLVIVDEQNNAPLYPEMDKKLWPIEAVYALIEVKTHLNPSDLKDAVKKGQKFKRLKRRFCDRGEFMRMEDSLFVIWAFESPSPETLRKNIIDIYQEVPRTEQPDFVIVPNSLMVQSGKYLELSKVGQPNSPQRKELERQHGNLDNLIPRFLIYPCRENSLYIWYIFFDSWLRQAGNRYSNPIEYLPKNVIFGELMF
ncbi:MAG: hypothetical protein OXF95_08415 [Rhodobacteraceae bacterium]|nr:hypothetical protein [Paracoccaceae bacterium]